MEGGREGGSDRQEGERKGGRYREWRGSRGRDGQRREGDEGESAASKFEPACDQLRTCLRPDSVMGFGFNRLVVSVNRLIN